MSGLSFVKGQKVKTFRFVPTAPKLRSSSALRVRDLCRLTHHVFRRQRRVSIRSSRTLRLRDVCRVNASTKKRRPGTVVTVGRAARSVHSNRIPLPRNCACCVLGFTRKSSFPFARVRVMCCRVTGRTKVAVVPSQLVRVRKGRRFLARHCSEVGKRGVRARALTTVGPSTADCRSLFRIYQGLGVPTDRRSRLCHEAMFGVVNNGISSRVGGFSFLVREGNA